MKIQVFVFNLVVPAIVVLGTNFVYVWRFERISLCGPIHDIGTN